MISIIGAGPAGSYLAYLLAKAGKDVSVYEEDFEIGKPVQCAGCVTNRIYRVLDFDFENVIINKIEKAQIFSLNNQVELNFKKPDLVIDREKFDKLIFEKAKEVGVKFNLGCRFLKFDGENIIFIKDLKTGKIKKIKTNILVGADGPLSKVAETIGIKRKVIQAVQARVKIPFEKNTFKVWFKEDVQFTWSIPESEHISKIGLISSNNAGEKLKIFLKEFDGEILEYQGGLVPLYENLKVCEGNVYLVGDAACQIKQSTGGGIVPGLEGAKCLARSIIKETDYEKELRSLNKEMKMHNRLRRILNRFNEEKYDKLVKFSNRKIVRTILERCPRDNFRILNLLQKLF